ncbi:MAG TPA: heme ABC exporter ATP-binding protein CcmA [Candidatus Limnocylindria bacterium]|nr:heme ABC exporter ATP-binding protein CcmA [Candidatus Limnocylindria bacterium]
MPQTTIYVAPRVGPSDNPPPAVATVELARLFGHSAALAGVSLRVEPGRSIALLGPNGAGKTTLLRILATAIRPTFGSAEVDGLDVARHADLVRTRVAHLSHAGGLYVDLTAAENLRFAARLLGVPSADVDRRVGDALDEVGLNDASDQRVVGFSAGMRKRLAIARLLLSPHSVLLLDEPHASLDEDGMQLVDRLIRRWRDAGITVLVASHATQRMQRLLDGAVRLEGGLVTEIAGDGVSLNPVPAATAQPTLSEAQG